MQADIQIRAAGRQTDTDSGGSGIAHRSGSRYPLPTNRIPLSEFLHINRVHDGPMRMEFGEHAYNHIRTAHASAQYALAEIGTGALLADIYPDHPDRLFAVLRRGELKYGKAAASDLTALATLSDEAREKLEADLGRRGRALVSVDVELRDTEGSMASTGRFQWYMERSDGRPAG